MKKTSGASSALCTRVARALALNRKAQLNFPGIFMNLTGRQLGDDGVTLEFADDPVLRSANDELSFTAVSVLVDIALGAVTRIKSGQTMRPATVRLDMQMTGAPIVGGVATDVRFVAFSERTRVKHAASSATIHAGGKLIGNASGAFVMLDLPEGRTQKVLPWLPESLSSEPLDTAALDPHERDAVKACRRAEAAATAAQPFIDHFWCGIPKSSEGKARLSVPVTAHLGNRVGQVHGGVLVGMAASVANAAAPATSRLSNISAWFISPGQGPRLQVRSSTVYGGRNLTVVRTQIFSAARKLVLDVTSQHVARAEQ